MTGEQTWEKSKSILIHILQLLGKKGVVDNFKIKKKKIPMFGKIAICN